MFQGAVLCSQRLPSQDVYRLRRPLLPGFPSPPRAALGGMLDTSASTVWPTRPTCCRFSTGRLAGPRVRTPLMTLRRMGSLKFCQIGSYRSLAFWPQTSANSWLSKAASSCGHRRGHSRGHSAGQGEEGQGLLDTGAWGSTAPSSWGSGAGGICLRWAAEQKLGPEERRAEGRVDSDEQ